MQVKLLTPTQMNAVDKGATERFGIPSILLMEHAAQSVFDHLEAEHKDEDIAIVCGPGNNGGDGLALARLVKVFTKRRMTVWMLASYEKLTTDGKTYYDICKRMGIEITLVQDAHKDEMIKEFNKHSLIVDALFGTGLSRPIEGRYKEIIAAINESNAKVVSIDIPSGIDGMSGKVQGIAIHADTTITFMAPKVGLFLYPALLYTGEIKVANIGIPYELIDEAPSQIFSIEEEEMASLLPKRPIRSNKGSFGKVLTIGGSLGMAGAISLTSLAAYRTGCGTVTTAVPCCIIEIMQQKLTEVMALSMPQADGFFAEEAAMKIEEQLNKYQVIGIGPGMGRMPAGIDILQVVLKSDKPCVIDADALFNLPQLITSLKERKAPTILTPHPGEMARITGKTVEEILDDPIRYAKEFAMTWGVILVLKIEKTVIADHKGNIYINRCGNSGLAKGGSGDTLTGILAGLLAQHLTPIDSARLGVYLQTKAADHAKEELSQYSYLPSDTINYLGYVFNELKKI